MKTRRTLRAEIRGTIRGITAMDRFGIPDSLVDAWTDNLLINIDEYASSLLDCVQCEEMHYEDHDGTWDPSDLRKQLLG